MTTHRSRVILGLTFILSAMAVLADEQVSPVVTIDIYGFTVDSSGYVYYYYSACNQPIICEGSGYIATGTHSITDGTNGAVTQSTFGGSTVTSYDAHVTTGSAYSHCYRASLTATGRYGTTQRVSSGEKCAAGPPPPPPPPPPAPDPGTGGCVANCDGGTGGTFDESGVGNDPLVISLSGPYKLSGVEDAVAFDINGAAHPQRIGWTAREADVAFLALDRNGNGGIDDGAELFGNATPLRGGGRASNGFAALAQYDLNGDGIIDAADPVWNDLLLWIDANHNGLTDPGELQRITASSITGIEVDHHWTGRRDQYGNHFGFEGHLHEGKAVRPFYDVFFVTAR